MRGTRFPGCIVLLLVLLGISAPAWGARWEPLPLWGGLVSLVTAEGNSSIVYAVSETAGLYQSIDQGLTWQSMTTVGPGRFPIRIVGVDPHDPRRLFSMDYDDFGAIYYGLYRSEDGGKHWQRSDAGFPEYERIFNLAFDPETPGRIYAATASGLYGSQDAGTTWAPIGLAEEPVDEVRVAPGDPPVVLARISTVDGGKTMRSSDRGETFVQVFGEKLYLAVDPAHAGRLYGWASSGLYRSDDAGVQWTLLPDAPSGWLIVRFDGTLLSLDRDSTSDDHVFRSLDGGITWESVPEEAPPEYFRSLAVLDDGTLLASGYSGVWRNRMEGQGWLPAITGIRAQTIQALAVAADADSTLWVGPETGIFVSRDAGASFQSRPAGLGRFASLSHLALHPRRPQVAYALGFGVLKTEDGGESWQPLFPGLDDEAVVAVDPVNPEYVYAGGFYDNHGGALCTGVRSTDGGATWRCMGPFPFIDFTGLAIDPHDRRVLYGIFGVSLYRSPNRGRTWDSVPSPSRRGWVTHVVLDPARKNRLYALTDEGAGVFRSDDKGRTWTRLAAGLPGNARPRDLLVDPARPGRLWVAVEVSDYFPARRQGSVFRSDDAGGHWTKVSAGLAPGAVVHHFAMDPRGADVLYAGTDGQGLYRLVVED